MFSGIPAINGDFVPHIGFEYVQFRAVSLPDTNGERATDKANELSFNAGIGVNMNIDRGFFWTGAEGFYENNSATWIESKFHTRSTIGGKLSVGVERNVLWDWFVLRAGATKVVALRSIDPGADYQRTYWVENPEADGSDNDHIAIGAGVNIENRFKVDGVIAEDVFYTFTNLISGNKDHLMTRISITYTF